MESQGSFDLFDDRFSEIMFSDRRFIGRTHELKAIVDGFTEGRQEAFVLLSVVSEEYFHYQWTVEMHRDASENPFAEPVQVYSNVRNGLGIFAALNTQSVPLVPE